MQTDKGGQQGPRSTRESAQSHHQRYRPLHDRRDHDDRYNNRNDDSGNGNGNGNGNNSSSAAPAVPNFGFQFPGMPNGFAFPPGFAFPGAMPSQGQPPPPGAS